MSIASRWTRAAVLAAAITGFGAIGSTGNAQALTYVTHCNSGSWPGAYAPCPGMPGGDRHTYTGGRAASSGTPYDLWAVWYVAFTSSNASSAKYADHGPAGTTLNSSFPGNTELLRGYSEQAAVGTALFGDGFY